MAIFFNLLYSSQEAHSLNFSTKQVATIAIHFQPERSCALTQPQMVNLPELQKVNVDSAKLVEKNGLPIAGLARPVPLPMLLLAAAVHRRTRTMCDTGEWTHQDFGSAWFRQDLVDCDPLSIHRP